MSVDTSIPQNFQVLVGGSLRTGRAFSDVINPASGAKLADVPLAAQNDLEEAVAMAHAALPIWSRDGDARRAALGKAAAVVAGNADRLANVLSSEIGLPFKLAQMEAAGAAAFLNYRARGEEKVDFIADDERQRVYVRRAAIGVTGAILPWNAPLLVASEKLATATAAGNAVILKPSPHAPLTVLTLGALLADAFPAGVLSVLPGGDDLGQALVSHPKVRMISFTGSIAAGQAIMAASAPGLKRLSLELGGNDAAIVLPDADVRAVARKLFMGAFFRGGQICVAIKRLYVHASIHDALVAELKVLAEATVLGDPFEPATTMGPLANRPQFERIKDIVARSLASGGTLVTGGAPLGRPGFFYPPTLLTDLPADAPAIVEEQFGPVLPVIRYDDVEEAIEAANRTHYGLGGSVWTSNTETGIAVASRLESGTAWVNQHGIVLPNVPCGGMKLSGVGRANGQVGLDGYSELQTISVALPKPA
jgi:acyl-CoA reductase-like NAD-dependent aldehyde dehydrogenase